MTDASNHIAFTVQPTGRARCVTGTDYASLNDAQRLELAKAMRRRAIQIEAAVEVRADGEG
ncbi:hypothetical protein [Ruegeria sp. Alg231-54]|uniref:hypothetical protein n=1 Tax=Ruegeria sp. Alg231-54 TaxID=1922221 RepID=UPI000D54F995|nr:hypothetical protein [Ruegeria sp. Alg231-54]